MRKLRAGSLNAVNYYDSGTIAPDRAAKFIAGLTDEPLCPQITQAAGYVHHPKG
jgi:hypothetical protein